MAQSSRSTKARHWVKGILLVCSILSVRITLGQELFDKDIKKADYLVQLSDCEAFCYSVVESLIVGTPVIVTNLPVYHELGICNKNAIICNLTMNNINASDITKKNKTFKYEPPKSKWNIYLDNNTKYNPNDKIKVRSLRRYIDIELGTIERNKEYEVKKERASYLECKNLIEYC